MDAFLLGHGVVNQDHSIKYKEQERGIKSSITNRVDKQNISKVNITFTPYLRVY